MKLTSAKKYKSIDSIDIELPDLTILTGLNGAGKTQILKAIETEFIEVYGQAGEKLGFKKFVSSQTLSPNLGVIATRDQFTTPIKELWDTYSRYLKALEENKNQTLAQFYGRKSKQENILLLISKFAKKEISKLTYDDIYEHYPSLEFNIEQDIFYQSFSLLFKRYHDRYIENKFSKFLASENKENEIRYLSEEEFVSTFGEAPWNFVNKILFNLKLDYRINSPKGHNKDADFEAKLINKSNNTEITFIDLSSGEKVLMSLALALYNANLDMEFPAILLMDEPDASLHPSMSKQFLEVIQNVFIEGKGVKVILTTHSPSTVAFAPEESLYIVNKVNPRIEKATKDKALRILTTGVPSFSVNYENRRQVFVESENDVLYYEKLYEILKDKLEQDISLTFISSGTSKLSNVQSGVSTCTQVIKITNTLREAGNKFVWGIIDWDTRNNREEHSSVIVLGEGKRYSIESYLLDPVLIAALLFREKIITRDDIGFVQKETHADFNNLDSQKINLIVSFISSKVLPQVKPQTDTTQIEVKLLNGTEILIPKWYAQINGHELEDALLLAFPELNKIKLKKENTLKMAILDKVLDDVPGIMSLDIFDLFKELQKL